MKKRKKISWFLMFVSIVMLTAAVFPHHHHNALLCLQPDSMETSICNHSEESCNHTHSTETNGCEDNKSNTQCSDCCITVFHCSEPDNSYDSMEPHYSLESILFTLTDIYFLLLHPEEKQVSNPYTFYHEQLHSIYFAKAKGLRAPPVFIA